MKTDTIFLLLIAAMAAGPLLAAEPAAPANAPVTNAPPATNVSAAASIAAAAPSQTQLAATPGIETLTTSATNATAAASTRPATTPSQGPLSVVPAVETLTNTAVTVPAENGTNCLRLNFRGVPLDLVLNYLSEAAGFIIVLEAQPRGKVDVWSSQPLTREEAVDLLNTVLNKNGFAAIRRGRTLTIINKDEAKTKSVPVRCGSEPESIPDNDEIVTQIIPVRYVEAAQLLKDLQPLISPQTAMTANESGNSVVITDTQCNIRRVAEVIRAIDMGAEDATLVKVFKLQYADPNEMSDLLVNLFPDETRSGGSQAPVQFGGGFRRFFAGFGGPGGPGGGSSTGSNTQNQRIKKRARVIAVPDPRTSSVVVCAARDLMDQIEGVVLELDNNPARKQTVKVIPIENADPQQAMQVLQDIFNKNGTMNTRNTANQSSALQTRSQSQNQQYNNQNMRQGLGNSSSTRRGFGN